MGARAKSDVRFSMCGDSLQNGYYVGDVLLPHNLAIVANAIKKHEA